jgi:hypothetical protein
MCVANTKQQANVVVGDVSLKAWLHVGHLVGPGLLVSMPLAGFVIVVVGRASWGQGLIMLGIMLKIILPVMIIGKHYW